MSKNSALKEQKIYIRKEELLKIYSYLSSFEQNEKIKAILRKEFSSKRKPLLKLI